ncbi:hypothetical protein J6590_073829 [Homalodisca vitripennis]|nr:hypothetical protein J6590_073829 [Homalodisca vitripennis]
MATLIRAISGRHLKDKPYAPTCSIDSAQSSPHSHLPNYHYSLFPTMDDDNYSELWNKAYWILAAVGSYVILWIVCSYYCYRQNVKRAAARQAQFQARLSYLRFDFVLTPGTTSDTTVASTCDISREQNCLSCSHCATVVVQILSQLSFTWLAAASRGHLWELLQLTCGHRASGQSHSLSDERLFDKARTPAQ